LTAVFQGITSDQSESSHVASRLVQKLKKMLGSLHMTNRWKAWDRMRMKFV